MGSDMFGAMNKPARATTQTPVQNPMAAVAGQMAGGGGGVAQPMNKLPNAMGQGFAQQKPMDAFAQKMQQRANPIMQGRPGMSAIPNSMGEQPMRQDQGQQANPFASGMMQSLNRNAGNLGSQQQIMQNQQAMRAAAAAQPMAPSEPVVQHGLQDVYSRMMDQRAAEQQPMQQQQNPIQMQQEPQQDLGSRDPRELARMGLGPSPQMMNPGVVMDENGLEPRRGAR